jgi:hypothetical protein
MTSGLCLILAAFLALPPFDAQGGPQQSASPRENGAARDGSAPLLDPDDLPVSIEKIQRALEREPAIRVEEKGTKFRVEVFGAKPTIEEILGPEFWRGPVAYGGMTHQEFLNMVTPKDVQGYAAFDNKQAAVVAITSFAFQYALAKAIKKFNEALKGREREEARREVEEALAALREARRKAGLPDK